jgi:hypothetical protein
MLEPGNIDGGLSGIGDEMGRAVNIINSFGDAANNMVEQAEKINKSFGLSRARIEEMKQSFADTVPEISRLGGSLNDVSNTIEQIAEGSRRNVIASTEQVSKLFAAQEIIGVSAGQITEKFANAGIEASKIGGNLEDAIKYVQSVGVNSTAVMKEVVSNTDKLNRFQFEGGVQGLTKMAAQASMLRFDMNKTFEFADKVLDPQDAVNMASAFQRLGVSVGGLADPFQLMNQSINDPSGLQDSLINMTKQYTYFDEKTKSFKINPQGVLTMRELAKETGISADQLSKTALAAADLDVRLSKVKINIPEDDKTLLANMATMGKGGEYEVKLTDEKGEVTTKNLTDVTKDEFDKLKKIQADAPKSLEDIQRSQLSLSKLMQGDVRAIADKFYYGVASTKQVSSNLEGIRNIGKGVTGGLYDETPKTSEIRQSFSSEFKKIEELFKLKKEGGVSNDEYELKLKKYEGEIKEKLSNFGTTAKSTLNSVIDNIDKKIKPNSGVESAFKEYITGPLKTMLGGNSSTTTPTSNVPTSTNTRPDSSEAIRNRLSGERLSPSSSQSSSSSQMNMDIINERK